MQHSSSKRLHLGEGRRQKESPKQEGGDKNEDERNLIWLEMSKNYKYNLNFQKSNLHQSDLISQQSLWAERTSNTM